MSRSKEQRDLEIALRLSMNQDEHYEDEDMRAIMEESKKEMATSNVHVFVDCSNISIGYSLVPSKLYECVIGGRTAQQIYVVGSKNRHEQITDLKWRAWQAPPTVGAATDLKPTLVLLERVTSSSYNG